MYYKVSINDNIRIPPTFIGMEVKEAIFKTLKRKYEGLYSDDNGVILLVTDVSNIGDGKILPGDAGIYYKTSFEAVCFKPQMNEVIEGEVIEIAEFGAFIRLGPVDGLVHVSQITDDFMSYSKEGVLQGKESSKSLKVGDKVRGKIITISHKQIQTAKVGLTMRQPGLGKLEWLEETEEKTKKPASPSKSKAPAKAK